MDAKEEGRRKEGGKLSGIYRRSALCMTTIYWPAITHRKMALVATLKRADDEVLHHGAISKSRDGRA